MFPDNKGVTESNFYLQKFCSIFGDCKCLQTRISLKKDISNACLKDEQYVQHILQTHISLSVSLNKSQMKEILCKFANLVLTVYRRAISAIRNIKLLLWFVRLTSCFNSGKIQCSPLKILRVGESLLNGQACDFSRFFRDSSFWKLPERSHPIFTCSKSIMETPE